MKFIYHLICRPPSAILICLYFFVVPFTNTHATEQIRSLIGWVEQSPSDPKAISWIKKQVSHATQIIEAVTSPGIPADKRRLWIIPASGAQPWLLSTDTRVFSPKWGKKDYIAFLQEADTNEDGYIDAMDQTYIRIIHANGGKSNVVGKGVSPVWSPDGNYLAFINKNQIWIYELGKKAVKAETLSLKGSLIVTDVRTKARANRFWLIPLDGQSRKMLPADNRNRYRWIDDISKKDHSIVFHDTMLSGIIIRPINTNMPEKRLLEDDPYSDFDPSWSPDGLHIVFVSERQN